MTSNETALAELIGEYHENKTQFLEELPNRVCEICGSEEWFVKEEKATPRHEKYRIPCRCGNCDGEIEFNYRVLDTEGAIPFKNYRVTDVTCSECSGPFGHLPLMDYIQEYDPAEVTKFRVALEQIRHSKIHIHHTSYEPEETIAVCDSCHAKIHHNDEFRNDLEPEVSPYQSDD